MQYQEMLIKYNEMIRSEDLKWKNDLCLFRYALSMGHDIDALTTAKLIEDIFGLEIIEINDFSRIWRKKGYENDSREFIYCDQAVLSGKGFCNHLTMREGQKTFNRELYNINNYMGVHRANYKHKYAGSTLLLTWTEYQSFIQFPKDFEALQVILAIDAAHKGYYNPDFHHTYVNYLKVLGIDEIFLPVLENSKSQDFYDIIRDYRLNSIITYDPLFDEVITKSEETGLQSEGIDIKGLQKYFPFDISLPQGEFVAIHQVGKKFLNCWEGQHLNKQDNEYIRIYTSSRWGIVNFLI
ncbi:hypothetical protein PG301_02320 [Parageobacillus sp. G301]|nr:hypothetical protein PG301_02320 [Parageobacillus sp. G301]